MLAQFRKHLSHCLYQHINKLIEKWFLKPKRTPITNSTPQNAAQDIVAVGIARLNAISNGETQGADVVADDPEGDVDLLLLEEFFARQGSGVFLAAQLLYFRKDRAEDIRVIIGNHTAKVGKIVCGLDYCRHTLKAHSGVDMFDWKRLKTATLICIVLDENKVPDFNAPSTIGIHHLTLAVSHRGKVNM